MTDAPRGAAGDAARGAAPIVALEAGLDADLSPLTARLWEARVPHRVVADERGQYLLVLDQRAAREVGSIFAALRSGATAPPVRARLRRGAGWLARAPVTAAIVALAVLVAPLSLGGDATGPLGWLFITTSAATPSATPWQDLHSLLLQGQLWRLLTPCLLHFSLLHLVMDVLLFAEFGRRIERGLGPLAAVASVVATGALSNVAQFIVGGSGLFGGLSGVVMGQLGFLLVIARREPRPILRVPAAMAIVVLLSSAVFATGITEVLGVYIANTAHWSGFAVGVLLAAIWPLRTQRAVDRIGPRSE